MKTTVKRRVCIWGKDPAIRIPKSILKVLDIKIGDKLDIRVEDGIGYLRKIPEEAT
jgi:antitoxin component of MazEF toxin-antitoxin module